MSELSEYSFTCPDAASTTLLGARIGQLLEVGDLVLLYGDLGAGKTTMTRGLIQSLTNPDTEIVSPTFTLVQTYPTVKGLIYHYDFYRLPQGDRSSLDELGWDDGLMSGITIVEWPDRILDKAPGYALSVTITPCPDGSRHIKCTGGAQWQNRLDQLRGMPG